MYERAALGSRRAAGLACPLLALVLILAPAADLQADAWVAKHFNRQGNLIAYEA
jgi:hypothetical protein